MLKIWLNKISSLINYNDLLKYGYNIFSVDDKELIDLWNKVIDAYIDIEDEKFIYQVRPMGLLESHKMVLEFFKELYGHDLLFDEIDSFLEKVSYRKAKDYLNANAEISRKFDVGSKEVYSFCIDMYDDILTTDLMIHEFSHALYVAPVEFLYDEVISTTFERIFADLNHSDLEILISLSAFKSSYYEGSLDVKDNNFRGKIKCVEKMYAKTYLIGYLTSLYLLNKYKDDPNTFRRLINMYKDSNNSSKEILDYYGFKFKSNEVDSLLDKDIEKVKKRMYS